MTKLILASLLLLTFSCAHNSNRDPASVQQEKETAHERHHGLFDRPNY